MDEALDRFDSALTDVITTIESGGLDQLATEEKVAAWQRFETIRNKLPLVDHRLIAHAEASDMPGSYCSATMMRFLMRAFQLSRAEAASRVRAAAALVRAPRYWVNAWSRSCRRWPRCRPAEW
jgi:hypothetical protein